MSHAELELVNARSESLRGALSRIQLAACELGRLVGTPQGQGLVERITRAVDDLDRVLSTEDNIGAMPAVSDLRRAVCEVFDRLRPAVLARGLTWLPPQLPGGPLFGDPVRLKRLAIAMVRAASGVRAVRGGLRLGLEGCGQEVSLHLHIETEGAPQPRPDGAPLATILRATERFHEKCDTSGSGRRWTVIVPGAGPALNAHTESAAGYRS